eukprot:Pompholyxophrys_sp_v1_NODE_1_length_32789_cov_6.460653.p1 type:complete len:722 gc:universal NODE_1_length_32789_cov_6.460653:18835-21000(+)
MDEPILKRGAIAQAACKMLEQEDCDTHPNCHWTQASKDKNGTVRKAHCGMTRIAGEYKNQRIRPSSAYVSPKRSAGAKRAATKNDWLKFLEDYRKTHPETKNMRVGDVAKAAKASGGYTPKGKKQTGGYLDAWGNYTPEYQLPYGSQRAGGCGINPTTKYCKQRPGDDDEFCSQGAKRCQKKKGSGAPKGIKKTSKKRATQVGAGWYNQYGGGDGMGQFDSEQHVDQIVRKIQDLIQSGKLDQYRDQVISWLQQETEHPGDINRILQAIRYYIHKQGQSSPMWAQLDKLYEWTRPATSPYTAYDNPADAPGIKAAWKSYVNKHGIEQYGSGDDRTKLVDKSVYDSAKAKYGDDLYNQPVAKLATEFGADAFPPSWADLLTSAPENSGIQRPIQLWVITEGPAYEVNETVDDLKNGFENSGMGFKTELLTPNEWANMLTFMKIAEEDYKNLPTESPQRPETPEPESEQESEPESETPPRPVTPEGEMTIAKASEMLQPLIKQGQATGDYSAMFEKAMEFLPALAKRRQQLKYGNTGESSDEEATGGATGGARRRRMRQSGGGCGINPTTNFCKTRAGDDDQFCMKGAKRCQKKKDAGAPKGIRKSRKQSGAKKGMSDEDYLRNAGVTIEEATNATTQYGGFQLFGPKKKMTRAQIDAMDREIMANREFIVDAERKLDYLNSHPHEITDPVAVKSLKTSLQNTRKKTKKLIDEINEAERRLND